MTEWRMKRFWSEALAAPAEGGWAIALDGKPVHTPARAPLVVPTAALAEAVAEEWRRQEEAVNPGAMPLTRAANSAIDKVRPQFDRVAEMLADYAETDLVCYRADSPEALADAQAQAWDPLMDWARSALRAPLVATAGILPVAQPAHALGALRGQVARQDPFALTALHDLVTLSGSLVIGLAAQAEVLPADDLWERSRVEEAWQERQWGRDAEAAEANARKRAAFLDAARFHTLLRDAA